MAPLWIPLLLRGEPGTGRAAAAACAHALGPTAHGAFVRIPSMDLARQRERALPGRATVVLESVQHLPTDAQAWWRGWLIETESRSEHHRIRWIATTPDAPLRELAPGFDRALERLLARFSIRLPPLRERIEDLPLLVSALCARTGPALGREHVRVSPRALEILASCHWPENLHELEDVLVRAIACSPTPRIGPALLADVLAERGESVGGLRAERAAHEREELLAALRASAGNVSRTAAELGRSRAAVYRLIEKHRIPLTWHRGRGASAGRGGRASARAADPLQSPRGGT